MIRRKILFAASAGVANLTIGCGGKERRSEAKREEAPADDHAAASVTTSAPASKPSDKTGPTEWLIARTCR
jgi:hypothetical protein